LSDDDWVTLSTLFYNVESTRVIVLASRPERPLAPPEITRSHEMAEMAAHLYLQLTGRKPSLD
jgi:hypothetical protein